VSKASDETWKHLLLVSIRSVKTMKLYNGSIHFMLVFIFKHINYKCILCAHIQTQTQMFCLRPGLCRNYNVFKGIYMYARAPVRMTWYAPEICLGVVFVGELIIYEYFRSSLNSTLYFRWSMWFHVYVVFRKYMPVLYRWILPLRKRLHHMLVFSLQDVFELFKL